VIPDAGLKTFGNNEAVWLCASERKQRKNNGNNGKKLSITEGSEDWEHAEYSNEFVVF